MGDIFINSSPGEGSCFTLRIKTEGLNDTAMVENASQFAEEGSLKKDSIEQIMSGKIVKGNVLLAEDNLVNQKLIGLYLKKAGINVVSVDNGKQAVEEALSNHYDLILMDMQMPEMGGLEATRILRQAGYGNPIVALTANALKDDKDKCLAAGCDDFLAKPIEQVVFYNMVTRFIEGK